MSGYNNFSYFNGPGTNNMWLSAKDAQKSAYGNERVTNIQQPSVNQWNNTVPYSEFNNQSITPNIIQNYAQNVPKSVDSRTTESTQSRNQVIKGTVTQLFSNFGYINDNIIFSKSDVVGQMVSVGDKVVVDATFQPNNPTKFKGERVSKIDDQHFNTVPNTIFGKIHTSVQPTTSQFAIPIKNRWDVQTANKSSVGRVDLPITITLDSKNDYQMSPKRQDVPMKNTFIPVQHVNMQPLQSSVPTKSIATRGLHQPISSRIDFNASNKLLVSASPQTVVSKNTFTTAPPAKVSPIQINATKKNPVAEKNVAQPISSRLDLSSKNRYENKSDKSSLAPRIDLTGRNYSDSSQESPRRDTLPKNRYDTKNGSRPSPSRSAKSTKIYLESKSESSKRNDDHSESNKRTSEKSLSSGKDKSSSDRDKPRHIETKSKRAKAMKSQKAHNKAEAVKRKALSPIRFQITPKKLPETKPVVETKPKPVVVKVFENFANRELDCAAVKNQFRMLMVPKEFFHVSLKYQHSFPLNHPMKLGNKCHFKIMDKKVKSIDSCTDVQLRKELDPKDADTTFVAKVMLLSTDNLAKLYKDTLALAEEIDSENKIPITKSIKFLVASVGEDKEFAIGGAWSPSLDGPDPETNPRVLINTAIRTCKAMTGIDLSSCSSWPKFLELRYYRPLQAKTETASSAGSKTVTDLTVTEEPIEYMEPRMETVVYYVPDIWNCVPHADMWKEITRAYQEQLACILCPPPQVTASAESSGLQPDGDSESKKSSDGAELDEEDWSCNDSESGSDDKMMTNSDESNTVEEQPTHFSKLVIVGMKIVDIKKELELRKLNNRGVMEQLKARLKAALDREELEEKNKEILIVATSVPASKELPKSTLTDEQKNELKKMYVLPDQPEIIVHQNRKIFGNQMKIRTFSLHSLLSYYEVKLPENTFELALFAKQFLDMLRRDAVFNIYKSIVIADEADLRNVEESSKKTKLSVTTSKRTINKPLLFSCTILDKERTNKIPLEDLKVLIEGLGICLSTNQLSAILEKIKDNSKYLKYRQLTDKEMTDSDLAKYLNADVSEDLDYIKELALGNKALFESETTPLDLPMTEDELERLKAECDRSERYRQSVELKVAELKDETQRNIGLVQDQAKEIVRLKDQAAEYKAKYNNEIERTSRYRNHYERLVRQVKDIESLATGLNRCVSDTIIKHEALNPIKKNDSKERKVIVPAQKKKTTVISQTFEDKSKEISAISSDLIDQTVDVPLIDHVVEDEDFDEEEKMDAEEEKQTEERNDLYVEDDMEYVDELTMDAEEERKEGEEEMGDVEELTMGTVEVERKEGEEEMGDAEELTMGTVEVEIDKGNVEELIMEGEEEIKFVDECRGDAEELNAGMEGEEERKVVDECRGGAEELTARMDDLIKDVDGETEVIMEAEAETEVIKEAEAENARSETEDGIISESCSSVDNLLATEESLLAFDAEPVIRELDELEREFSAVDEFDLLKASDCDSMISIDDVTGHTV